MHPEVADRSSAYAQQQLNCEDAEGTQQVIMVCIADADWTAAALGAACRIARGKGARIILLAAVRTEDPYVYTATSAAPTGSNSTSVGLKTYCEMAEDFGLPCEVQRCVDPSQPAAIVAVAASSGASIVFARLPDRRFPLQSALQYRALRWRLAELGCDLYIDGFVNAESMFPTYALP